MKLAVADKRHRKIQSRFAEELTRMGSTPLSPTGTPLFDVAWYINDTLYVAEVKSTTAENQETQLRLALGQVLRYVEQLGERLGVPGKPFIVVDTRSTMAGPAAHSALGLGWWN